MPLALVIGGYHKGEHHVYKLDRKTVTILRPYHPAMKLGDKLRAKQPESVYKVGRLYNKYGYLKYAFLYPQDWSLDYAQKMGILSFHENEEIT